MKTTRTKMSLIILNVLVGCIFLLTVSCSSEEDDSNSNLKPISSDDMAEQIVEELAEQIIDQNVLASLSHGTYSDQIVNGRSGTAKVTGTYEFQSGIDCGYDCIKSESNVNVTVIFGKYKVISYDNCEATIASGAIRYTDETWSEQYGLNYSSGGTIKIEGTDVKFKDICDGGSFGYDDVLSFSASGSSVNKLHGWCTASDGNTYQF